MEVSEEQKRRMEANRAAALARRNAKLPHRSLAPQNSLDFQRQAHQSTVVKPCMGIENHTLSIPSTSANDPFTGHGPGNQTVLQGCGTEGQSTDRRVRVALEICAPDRFFLVVRSGLLEKGFLETISSVSRFLVHNSK
jgi:hypothetical protein